MADDRKRPLGPADVPDGDVARRYRKRREDTPSHTGGVNEAAAARIAARVKNRIVKGDGLFSKSDRGSCNTAGGSSCHSSAAPAAGSASNLDWAAPRVPGHVAADRAQFGSEARGFILETPQGTPALSHAASIPSRVSATPLPSPSPGLSGRSRAGATPLHPSAHAEPEHAGAGHDEWDQESSAGDEASRDTEDQALDRSWYDAEEEGRSVDYASSPFLGDAKLFEKREEALRKRVNHRKEARLKDADRCDQPARPRVTRCCAHC